MRVQALHADACSADAARRARSDVRRVDVGIALGGVPVVRAPQLDGVDRSFGVAHTTRRLDA